MRKNSYLIVCIVLILFLSIYMIYNKTSGRYKDEALGESKSVRVAKFKVKVSSLVKGELKSFENDLKLDLLEETGKENIVKEGMIAPGFKAIGSFVIDTTGTEVSTTYKISIGNVKYGKNILNNFNIYSIKATYNNKEGKKIEENLTFDTIDNLSVVEGQIPLDNINNPITIELTMSWDYADDIENILGIESAELSVPVKVTVTQKD